MADRGSALFYSAFLGMIISGVSLAQDDKQAVVDGLERLLPGVDPEMVSKSEVPGLYEVMMGPRLVYMSADGKYLIQGPVFNLETSANITEPKENLAKKRAIASVAADNMISFPSEHSPAHEITVFTDIDCGYCRKLHREIEQYNDEGISVRYLFFPRAGIGSESYDKAVSVWCAKDRRQAMTDAKNGKPLEEKTCENPVKEHYALGKMMGISGTPAIILEDGRLVPGYVPAKRLTAYFESEQ